MGVNRRDVLSAAGAIAGLSAVATISEGAAIAAPSARRGGSGARDGGFISMGEGFTPSGLLAEYQSLAAGPLPDNPQHLLQDLTGRRLEEMDACGIGVQVLGIEGPSPQYVADPRKAAVLAKHANDALAREISKRPERFVGMASLSMHNPDEACAELERAVKHLGMRGVQLNGFQRAANEGNGLFYDDSRYNIFWATLERLNVPLYLHPGNLTQDPGARDKDLAGAGYPWLNDAAWGYGITTGLHALRIIFAGIFDRYPAAQMILGHNGELVVSDVFRLDNWVNVSRPDDDFKIVKPYKTSIKDYCRTNIHITTSGSFSTPMLKYAISQVGAERIMFAVDYPYESSFEATDWLNVTDIDPATRSAIAHGNAARLLKLG